MPTEGSFVRRAGRPAILLAVFVMLWVGLPIAFLAAGAGHWLKQMDLGTNAFRYLLLGSGLTILVLITMALRREGLFGTVRELGLTPFTPRAVLGSLLAVATMAAILRLRGQGLDMPDVGSLVASGIAGTFAEEVGFRGFLFLQFRRWVAYPFWLAALLSSGLFGFAHYGQGHTFAGSLAATGVTFLGGVLFCWLTERWGNLWAAVVLHAGLNIVWTIFHLSDDAVGNLLANEARLTAVAVVIATTLAFTRRPPEA